MGIFWISCFSLLVLSRSTLQASLPNSTNYVGAVAEYYPVKSGTNASEIAKANANNYVTIVKKAAEFETDIIVFPESSLTTGLRGSATNRTSYPTFSSFVPHPNEGHIACNNSSTIVIEALQILSCAARNYSMYIVVNLHEKENCTASNTTSRPCPSDGFFFYNTNVVFSRNGSIVARYRKYNLFGEPGFNVTATPDISTFTTDFNVTFGQFICFDILFAEPTLTYVRNLGITDILFSAHWFSELPYLTNNQVKAGWAHANNVNLLGSSFNTASTGSGGSGIYAGRNGSLVQIWSENNTNVLLVARIPKVVNGSRVPISNSSFNLPLRYTFNSTEISTVSSVIGASQQNLLRDPLAWTTSVLDPNTTSAYNLTLCDRSLCCSFATSTTFNSSLANGNSSSFYRYRFAVFNGVRSFSGVATGGVQVCSIVACTNAYEYSCGRRFDAGTTVVYPTVFRSIVISGNFSTSNDTFQVPNSLTTKILPLNASEFTYSSTAVNTTYKNLRIALNGNQSELLTFAIYGRNFTADGLNVSYTIASSARVVAPMVVMSFITWFVALKHF